MFDTIIIGSGPAGMTAAIYAARREMKALVIGKHLGGQVAWASEIENYPGFKTINNYELIDKMKEQVEGLGVEIKTAEIKKIEKINDYHFKLITEKEEFEAKTVIIAMGLIPRRLAIPGEREFSGKGVSYCANCDGPFFKNKIVAVVGGGNAALDAAEVLSKIAGKVYLVHRRDEFKAFEALVQEVKAKENIELILNSEITEIVGDVKVNKIIVKELGSVETREYDLDGVFIEVGRIAHTDLLENIVKRDENSQILVDDMCKTSQKGIFACGDVTQVEFKQITIACGQATIAALSAYQHLQTRDGGEVKPIVDRSIKKS